MTAFVSTDSHGNFTLEGKPHFLHGATYFGRRPGTCGANWLGENFAHNRALLAADLAAMSNLGLNMLGLFVPAREFFRGVEPNEQLFSQLDDVLADVNAAGLRVVLFALGGISQDAWCRSRGIDAGPGLWNPAVNPEAEACRIASCAHFMKRYADHPEVIGYPVGAGRFFRYGFDVPPVRPAWADWLKARFRGDFGHAAELLDCASEEATWDQVRMPTEMEPYFNQDNPRSFEFALMQQTLTRASNERIVQALRTACPRQLIIEAMEGCCFSTGHLTTMIPEQVSADAIWLESYHWEGLRSYHIQSVEERRWMAEPVADKPSVDIGIHAGYVQMLTRWMRRSGKPLILCHGVDIGEEKRGVRDEADQELMVDRFNTYFQASGGHGINYWCWSDDELSKTFTRQSGVEFTIDTAPDKRPFWQAGETMGQVRFDGRQRPVCDRIRERAAASHDEPVPAYQADTLVVFPCPQFQSLYRYRANLTGFALLTGLTRQGILAEVAMSSAGTVGIGLGSLAPHKLVVLGAAEYTRDHPQTPEVLERYVRSGGAVLITLGYAGRLQDEYLRWRNVAALKRLAGAAMAKARQECATLDDITGVHPSFDTAGLASWSLTMDRPAFFTKVTPVEGAELLVLAGGCPLLYRHRLDAGMVYVFTWDLDVLLYKGGTIDYRTAEWDFLWRGLAQELGLRRQTQNPMAQIVRDMSELDNT
jgi:hypothetical protein